MLLLALEPVAFIPSIDMQFQTTFSVCLITQHNKGSLKLQKQQIPESTISSDSSISVNSTTPSSPIASTSGIQNLFIFPSPSKSLQEIMPIPVVPPPKGAKRNIANVLTSADNIKKRQLLKAIKQEKIEKALERNIKKQSGQHATQIIHRKNETKKVESKTSSKKGNKEKSKNITKNKSIKTAEDYFYSGLDSLPGVFKMAPRNMYYVSSPV